MLSSVLVAASAAIRTTYFTSGFVFLLPWLAFPISIYYCLPIYVLTFSPHYSTSRLALLLSTSYIIYLLEEKRQTLGHSHRVFKKIPGHICTYPLRKFPIYVHSQHICLKRIFSQSEPTFRAPFIYISSFFWLSEEEKM